MSLVAEGRPALIAALHLLPLPGSPAPSSGLEQVVVRARADARTMVEGGVDAIIVENLGDAPFAATQVEPFTIAAMTRVALAVQQVAPKLSLGINVLRNDAIAAVSIAAAVGAQFIRVNVHTGVMATDQGLIQGTARRTLLERNRLGANDVAIAADVLVKHATPLGGPDLVSTARDTWHRGRCAALILSGSGTGQPTDPEDLHAVRVAIPDAQIWIGSGVDPDSAEHFLSADAIIVGTYLHRNGALDEPVELARVKALRDALRRT